MLLPERDRIREAWKTAGLDLRRAPELRPLVARFLEAGEDGWSALWREVRAGPGRWVEQLGLPLWSSGDRVLRLRLIRTLEPGRPDERKLLHRIATCADPAHDLFELKDLAERGDRELASAVAALPGLPVTLRQHAEQQLREAPRTEPEPAPRPPRRAPSPPRRPARSPARRKRR